MMLLTTSPSEITPTWKKLVLWREGSPRKPLSGVMQLNVTGESAGGTPTTLALKLWLATRQVRHVEF